MPGRRMAGARAQAFVLNPFAVLGEDADSVIDEQAVVEAQQQAGLTYERFTPQIRCDDHGDIQNVGLLIESVASEEQAQSEYKQLSIDQLEEFVDELKPALKKEYSLLAWEGYDLALSGEATTHLEALETALEEWRTPRQVVSWEDVYDLGRYSDRVKGIGTPETYYSPYIVKKDNKGEWFPDNLRYCIGYKSREGENQLLHVGSDEIEDLQQQLNSARGKGDNEITTPWLPQPMPVNEAERVLEAFADGPPPEPPEPPESPESNGSEDSGGPEFGGGQAPTKSTLLLHANIQHLDYEQRRQELADYSAAPRVPSGLRGNCSLLEHQASGLAWLQHLYGSRPSLNASGAILADDMGLGKTLQLLAFMAELLEADPDIEPMLVVAPVALLHNWKAEVERFFESGALPLLVAYGRSLSTLKLPREAIDQRLRNEAGLVDFLQPGWVGDKKLVLTTYETLRNLEFSFAAQPWSVMVCDEAQKIKNPSAMVTRAAKKQKAAFKIGCTGTPVENTLADLWCLFDFVQPGLLGALDEFGKRYRKPIEAGTNEEKARAEELRSRIAPQIMRRTKGEVAKDLPAKVVDDTCRNLALSDKQRNLYAKAVQDFSKRDEPNAYVPFKNHLGLLHYLRLVCTDPRRHGSVPSLDVPLDGYRRDAPKMDWLISQLELIRTRKEKVIVFCEFREIQRLVKHYVRSSLNVDPDIINGTTSSETSRADSRQKRIDAFQKAPGFGVIILSPMAVGFGLNIQAANHVVHYTRTWNPAKEDQATDRAYRIGQERDVHVYYPVVVADDFTTFDARLDQLLGYKRELARDMLNGSGDIGSGEFDVGEGVPADTGVELDPRLTIELTDELNGRYFEGLVAVLWRKQGYNPVILTPSSGDYGVDVVAISGNKGLLIQTKVSASRHGQRLGWNAVQEVVAGEAYYEQEFPGVTFEKVCVTNQRFNDNAHQQAKLQGVRLIERRKLSKIIKRYAITQSDIDAELHG